MTRGICLILVAEFMYVLMWACTKHLGTTYPASQIMLFRMIIALGITAIMIRRRGGFALLRTSQPGSHFLRSALGTASMFLAIWCIPQLTLGAVGTITQLGPVFIAIMGVLFLREKTSPALLIALGGGLVGALLAAGDTTFGLSLAVAVLLLSNLLYSASIVMTRQLVKIDNPLAVVFYASLMAMVVSGIASLFEFAMPTAIDALFLLGVGITSGLAQFFIAEAHRHAEASELAPFAYSNLLWAFLLGALFWSEYPAPVQLAGAALVLLSTLYLWYKGRKAAAI